MLEDMDGHELAADSGQGLVLIPVAGVAEVAPSKKRYRALIWSGDGSRRWVDVEGVGLEQVRASAVSHYRKVLRIDPCNW